MVKYTGLGEVGLMVYRILIVQIYWTKFTRREIKLDSLYPILPGGKGSGGG